MVIIKSELAKEKFSPGEHTGVIIEEEIREYEKYKYVDYYIENKNKRIKTGFNLNLIHDEKGNPKSELAKFMKELGIDITKSPDTKDVLGKKIKFYVKKEIGEDTKEYPFILKESITSVEEVED